MDRSVAALARHRVLSALIALSLVGSLILYATNATTSAPRAQGSFTSATPATQFFSPWWTQALGSDQGIGPAQIALLNDARRSNLAPADVAALTALLGAIAKAQLDGTNRSAHPEYFPPNAAAPECANAHILAVAPVQLPVNQITALGQSVTYAKAAVVYTASCPALPLRTPQVIYLYARHAATWSPIPAWKIPGAYAPDAGASPTPPSWRLKHFSSCGSPSNSEYRDLIVVVDAFELLCQDALRHGVSLRIASAFRTPKEQAELFAEAVSQYGSISAASHWVAPATATSCASRHCAGAAIDLVDSDQHAIDFVSAVVGCVSHAAVTLGPTSCPSTSSPITRLERYGFIQPAPQIPSYLAFALSDVGTPNSLSQCSPPQSLSVPQIIASVFRCRLSAAQVTPVLVATTVQEALVVSRCESDWNPGAQAFAGQWRNTPNPLYNRTFTNAGVFMLDRAEAKTYMAPGGSVSNAVDSANAAASMWLTTRSWQMYGCATGRGIFDTGGPVLPQYQGPPLPLWTQSF